MIVTAYRHMVDNFAGLDTTIGWPTYIRARIFAGVISTNSVAGTIVIHHTFWFTLQVRISTEMLLASADWFSQGAERAVSISSTWE